MSDLEAIRTFLDRVRTYESKNDQSADTDTEYCNMMDAFPPAEAALERLKEGSSVDEITAHRKAAALDAFEATREQAAGLPVNVPYLGEGMASDDWTDGMKDALERYRRAIRAMEPEVSDE